MNARRNPPFLPLRKTSCARQDREAGVADGRHREKTEGRWSNYLAGMGGFSCSRLARLFA